MNIKHLIGQTERYAPKGERLESALLIKGLHLSKNAALRLQLEKPRKGDRKLVLLLDVPAGTVIGDQCTASGFTRTNGAFPGFTDLRDALWGKSLGLEEQKRTGRTRQRGLLQRVGINRVFDKDDFVPLEVNKI